MTASHDDRIPLRFGTADQAGPGDALLLDESLGGGAGGVGAVARFRPVAAHGVFCVCCAGRTPAATALGRLFQDRATGRVPWFGQVVAVVADPGALAEAVRSDRVVAARFRLER
jgi:hypothetical protein